MATEKSQVKDQDRTAPEEQSPAKATWAPDDSESEQSPNYQRQLQEERQERKRLENEKPSHSLITTIGSNIQNFVQTATHRESAVSPTQPYLQRSPTRSPEQKKPKAELGRDSNNQANRRTTEHREKSEELSLTSLDDKTITTLEEKEVSIQKQQNQNDAVPYEDNNFDGWGEINDYEEEEEDEANSINSGVTTKVGRKEMDKIVIPTYIRYQMMIPPEEDSEEDDDNPGYKDNYERIVEILKSLVTQLGIMDDKAEIISWKTQNNFSFLPKQEFPTDVSTIAKYFKGFRKKMRSDRRIYIKFGLHTKNDMGALEEGMKEWVGLYSYTFTKCLIQSDDAGFVGVICYTSQFTDTEIWRKHLMKETRYEWGFKLVPITSSDKNLPWNKRLKAVGVYVPIQYVDEAKFEISELLLPEETPSNTFPYLERFVFLPPEDTLGDDPEPLIAYQSFVMRHRSHMEHLKCKPSVHMKIDLDHIIPSQSDPTLTLRKIILGITVKDKSNPLFGTPLFHSVDFTPDINKLWIPNKPPDIKAAVIFTFYEPVKNEAQQMVVGLGRYVARMYGSEIAKHCFNHAHWKATKGWRYRSRTGTFDRPDTKNLLTTMAYDNNLSAIRRLQQISLTNRATEAPAAPTSTTTSPHQSSQEVSDRYNDVAALLQDTGSVDNSTNSSGGSGLTEAVIQQENDMMARIREQRSQAQKLVYKGTAIQNVHVNEDQSVVSNLTDKSTDTLEAESTGSCDSIKSESTTNSQQGQMKFNQSLLSEIITPSMTYDEAITTAEAYFKHRVNRETSNKDRILHTFLATKFPQQHKEQILGLKKSHDKQMKKSAVQSQDKDNPMTEVDTEDLSELDKQVSKPVPDTGRGAEKQVDHYMNKEGDEELTSSQNTGHQP